ncbi:extracellular solute-binding protein [Rhizobium lentis]|uniref:Spermidine/putrescine-binding protein n=2 Tax=Rhizobium lentis TaxID=1138194 RepID=A0A7W8XKB5_9HYPH|nr:extracellular solute-binding protein [Rhizobium lentis]MBB4577246.1 spermidine/putrescine-binding protein [Rhizobium lentis]MBB5553809.1 spermidine/putrescine-binding protein [Rhizobium lentis]MBB5564370.1 spermidine/putrescine-binding protein [Rhizobium lentis]MBB5570830.1 spermidine/putrescine-binding protein [Rhizobium lentis]
MRRREFISLSVASALAAPAILRAQDKSFSDITLQVNGYGGDYDRLMTEFISKPLFERTGLKVVFTPGASQAAVAKVIATPDNPPYDIILCDSPSLPELITAGVIEPITNDSVPGVSRLRPGMREFDDYGIPIAVASMVLTYNTDHVKEPLTSFADLARPVLKDRVGMFNLENTGGLLFLIALAEGNGGGMDNIDPGFTALAKIAPNVASTTPSTVNLQQLFQQEEIWAGGLWDGRVHALRLAGMPLELVAPTEGLYAVRSYFNPVKNSKHPEAVRAFIEQAMSGELVGEIARFFRFGPTTDVQLPDDVASTILTYGERAKMIKPVNWRKVAENRASWFSRFNREMR